MWCFIATFLVLLKTRVVVATIIGNGEAYDNYVLPTSHIAKLLDGMRRLPSWAAGSDFDPKHEFEVSKNYHRRLQEDWPDINSIMALANAGYTSRKIISNTIMFTIIGNNINTPISFVLFHKRNQAPMSWAIPTNIM